MVGSFQDLFFYSNFVEGLLEMFLKIQMLLMFTFVHETIVKILVFNTIEFGFK